MTFEVFTNSTNITTDSYPSVEEMNVRFLFSNGSAAANPLNTYPLFGSNAMSLSWTDFVNGMDAFAIGNQSAWCRACGNSTGVCAGTTATSSGSAPSSSGIARNASSSGGMSKVVAGVIGAMVTLAVILGLEALILLVGGIRFVRKRNLGSPVVAGSGNGGVSKVG